MINTDDVDVLLSNPTYEERRKKERKKKTVECYSKMENNVEKYVFRINQCDRHHVRWRQLIV